MCGDSAMGPTFQAHHFEFCDPAILFLYLNLECMVILDEI